MVAPQRWSVALSRKEIELVNQHRADMRLAYQEGRVRDGATEGEKVAAHERADALYPALKL